MVSPINVAATVGGTDEVAIKNDANASPHSSDAVRPETGHQAVPKLDGADGRARVKGTTSDKAGHPGKKGDGEVRKMLLEDGKVIINVYDSNGKLLRKTPPGYLPAGERGFNVTI